MLFAKDERNVDLSIYMKKRRKCTTGKHSFPEARPLSKATCLVLWLKFPLEVLMISYVKHVSLSSNKGC